MGKKPELTADRLEEWLEQLEEIETAFWGSKIRGKNARAQRLQKAQEFTLPHLSRSADCMRGMLEVMNGDR